MSLLNSAVAMKCYVCGHGSEGPFAKMNATIRQKIHKSCDEFDRIPLEEKFKYEMECPETSVGCTLNVKGESLSRVINHAENIQRHEASDKYFPNHAKQIPSVSAVTALRQFVLSTQFPLNMTDDSNRTLNEKRKSLLIVISLQRA